MSDAGKKMLIALGAASMPILLFLALKPLGIAGNSMAPTIRDGDRVIVERISRYLKAPVRGELMVFREPHERKEIFVKRVIGLPGETVKVERDSVTILHADGRKELFQGDAIGGKDNGEPHTRVLGPEDYFVMGDNRSVSTDSRHWGTVQPPDIIGRPLVVLRAETRGAGSFFSNLAFKILSFGSWEGREASGAYRVVKSLRFNDDDSAYLNRTPASETNRDTWTLSLWAKRANLGTTQWLWGAGSEGANHTRLGFTSGDLLTIRIDSGGTSRIDTTTSGVFRDPNSWYHIVLAVDTTHATAANRVRIYINSVEQTLGSTFSSQNNDTTANATVIHTIGRNPYDSSGFFDGYMADVHFIDGQALTPSSFGETDTTTGAWKPKSYSGSYGTNGFKLDFSDCSGVTSSTLGNDASSNNNDWTPNNFSVTAGSGNDCLTDSPTNYGTGTSGGDVRGNFGTWSPIAKGANVTLANGNLDVSYAAVTTARLLGTFGMSSGKWYWEVTPTGSVGANSQFIGISSDQVAWHTSNELGTNEAYSYVYRNNGQKSNNSSSSTYGNTYTSGDVIGIAYDADNGKLFFAKNGTWQASGDPAAGTNAAFTGLSGTKLAAYSANDTGGSITTNFGQRAFTYTPPMGFKPLVTQYLSSPTIAKPSSYFDAKTYTGTGAALSVTGLGFQPELVWLKDRSAAKSHMLFDTLRNVFPYLSSNSTGVETGGASTTLTAFTSDGFVLGTNSLFNTNTNSYISWNWDESSTPGFDIVTYTGTGSARTVSHSLGSAPEMMIVKNRSSAGGWEVFHTSIGATKYLNLESTDAAAVSSALWNDTAPTASVFTVGTNANVNGSGSAHVAYLWSEVEGFSKFGSYTGNGSADGPFVYTGFKPRFILFKRADNTGDWVIYDTARDPYNDGGTIWRINPNGNYADEDSTHSLDGLANGFKVRGTHSYQNASGGTYVYAAFAENVFKGPDHNSGYQIARSLRFNSADSAYLSRSVTAGNRKTFTYSFWFKRATSGADDFYPLFSGITSSDNGRILMRNDQLEFFDETGGNTTRAQVRTSAVFRDPSAWYHAVVAIDTTQATAANRVRIYINGTEVTSFAASTYPSQNTDLYLNSTLTHYIGGANGAGQTNAYFSDMYFIDGQQLTPSSFGETDTTTGMWKPKTYSGSYGTNGFNLNFSDNSGVTSSTLGNDTSGVNNNDWTPNNFSVTAGVGNDSLTDTPTNYGSGTSGGDIRGNFATWSSIGKGSSMTLSNGNLDFAGNSGADQGVKATWAPLAGKWYWENTLTAVSSGASLGICGQGYSPDSTPLGSGSTCKSYYYDGNKYDANTASAYGNSYTTNDVISVALDMDNGKVWFGKNGTWQASGDPAAGTNAAFTGLSGNYYPVLHDGSTASVATWTSNFGQRAFTYTPPTGFKPLVATNISTSTIQDPSDYFDAKTYTGTGAALSVTGLEFQPNLVWIKDRTSTNAHGLFDSSRTAYPALISNGTGAEVADSTTLTSFDSTGFSIVASSTINTSSNSYISWNWDEGATPGFDIVTYTGTGVARTVSHSLGSTPELIMVKRRETAGFSWSVGSPYLTSWAKELVLDSTAAEATNANAWNSTAPTSAIFTVGTSGNHNASGGEYVAYLWSEVEGFSKFGSYTGNGSADGPFVYTGFKPRWLLIKRTDVADNWMMYDSARSTYNPVFHELYAQLTNAEGTSNNRLDLTANGFKLRSTDSGLNTSSGTYIYAAFAEMPFKYSSAGFGGVTAGNFLFGFPF